MVEKDSSHILYIEAHAGSSLLFTEILLHATGPVLTDRERMVIISDYIPRNHAAHLCTMPSEFTDQLPEDIRPLIAPSPDQHPGERNRPFGKPVGSRTDRPPEAGGY